LIGAVVVPGCALALLMALPWLYRSSRPRLARVVGFSAIALLTCAAIALSVWAILEDRRASPAVVHSAEKKLRSGAPLSTAEARAYRAEQYHAQKQAAAAAAVRAFELAGRNGIPVEGAQALLRNDPPTQAPRLFAQHCAACHRWEGHNGLGSVPVEPATSSDLAGYGSRQWIRGFLEDPMADGYFGRMRKPDGESAHTRMADWLSEQRTAAAEPEARRVFENNLDAAAAYLAEEATRPGRLAQLIIEPDADLAALEREEAGRFGSDEALIRRGRRFFMSVCNECHSYQGERSGTFKAPDMHGYGSAAWVELMIAEPDHESRYRSRGKEPAQMPRFKDRLAEADRRMLALWISGQGQPEPPGTSARLQD
jgi:ubiquinol-cytochrome c reductase cytochrome b subunit